MRAHSEAVPDEPAEPDVGILRPYVEVDGLIVLAVGWPGEIGVDVTGGLSRREERIVDRLATDVLESARSAK